MTRSRQVRLLGPALGWPRRPTAESAVSKAAWSRFESGRGHWTVDGRSHGGILVDPSARGADSARSLGSSPGESTDRDIDQQVESSVSEAESPGSNPGVPTVGDAALDYWQVAGPSSRKDGFDSRTWYCR